MKKLSFSTVCVFLLMTLILDPHLLFGSETRTLSMGIVGPFIRDNSNVLPFPGTLLKYNKQIISELRVKDDMKSFSGGIHIPLMETNYTVGVYLNRSILPVDPLGVGTNVSVPKATDLLFGMKMGNNDLGFRVSWGADTFSQDSTTGQQRIDETGRYIEIAGGLSNEKYDVGINISLPSVDNETGQVKDEWSGFGLGINGRYFHQLSKKMQFVPVALFYTMSGEATHNPGGGAPKSTADYSELFFDIAGAINYQVADQSQIILGLGAYTHHSTNVKIKDGPETTTTFTSTPIIYIGGESRLSSWIVGRLGAYQNFETSTTKAKPQGGKETETSTQSSFLNISFGIGVEVGQILIDLDINNGSLFEGTNILSGRARDIFNRVSVTYNFD